MKLEYLSTLQAVIRHGSFAGAAAESHLTPSGVSQRMQQLERHFGRPLFNRSEREAKPTPLALEVAAMVGGVLDGLEALRERRPVAVMGRVRIGALISAQLSMMPACLVRLRRRHPTLEVDLKTGSSQGLLAALAADEVDVAIVVRPETETRGCCWHALRRESFALIVPLASSESTVRRAAAVLPWIRYNVASASGRTAARFVRSQVPGIRSALDVMPANVIVAMVAAGLGFSVMPRTPSALLHASGARQIPLDRWVPTRQIALAHRGADADNQRVQAVVASIREEYQADSRRVASRAA